MYSATGEGDKLSASTSAQACHRFSLSEIVHATNNFNDEQVLGEGGFGKVYKAHIGFEEDGLFMAIKRLNSGSNQGEAEFRAEIEMLSKLRHSNVVSLIGYCDDNKEMILVYEYMPHGTLYNHLHKAETPLDWVQRLNIAIGAARGLDYIHTGDDTQHGVIHRDVKSSNILLDENLTAMISDFGLSKISPNKQSSSDVDVSVSVSVRGTWGYLDPEYFYTRRLTRKTDVYAFGVVLFELLSGRLAVDKRLMDEECSLVRWAQKCVKDGKFNQMVDSSITGTINPKCLRQFAQIAYSCLLRVPKQRPTMNQVVSKLQAILDLQEKYDNSTEPSGLMGFSWIIPRRLVSTAKQNSDQSGTSSRTSPGNKDGGDHGEMPFHCGEIMDRELKEFTYGELVYATRHFAYVLPSCIGINRIVYKGWLAERTNYFLMRNSKLVIAVTRLKCYKHFDLKMLKECCHPNLVKLIGYCVEGSELLLVYEFMHNENFQDLIDSGAVAQLPLVTKVKIAVGIARGVSFLQKIQHYFGEHPVSNYRLERYDIHLDKV